MSNNFTNNSTNTNVNALTRRFWALIDKVPFQILKDETITLIEYNILLVMSWVR